MFGTPSLNATGVHGYVYEGDRFGGVVRTPAEVAPFTLNGIMASNHYWKYHADPLRPQSCNGVTASFSSLWRYEAGKNKVESWVRSKVAVSVTRMRELLQTVGHGSTEHSIIFLPDQMRFEIAVARANNVWDAPYNQWHSFTFKQLFEAH